MLLSVFSLTLQSKSDSSMKTKEFFGKFLSLYLWGNLLAMALFVVALCFGVKYGLELYTRHGKEVTVPKLVNMTSKDAHVVIDQNKLNMVISDSGFNKRLPAGTILTQSPAPGVKVKPGHIIYVTVNAHISDRYIISQLCGFALCINSLSYLLRIPYQHNEARSIALILPLTCIFAFGLLFQRDSIRIINRL